MDPIYAGLLDPQSWNRYTYVLNSPLTYFDPTGLLAQGQSNCYTRFTDASSNTVCLSEDALAWLNSSWNGGGSSIDLSGPGNIGGRGQTPQPPPPPPIFNTPATVPPVIVDQPPAPTPPTRPKASAPAESPASSWGSTITWGTCFAIGTAALAIPVEAAVVAGCAGTVIGFPACVVAADHALAGAMAAHMVVTGGVCTAMIYGKK